MSQSEEERKSEEEEEEEDTDEEEDEEETTEEEQETLVDLLSTKNPSAPSFEDVNLPELLFKRGATEKQKQDNAFFVRPYQDREAAGLDWVETSWGEYAHRVRVLARAVLSMVLPTKSTVAILAETSPEAMMLHMACMAVGVVVVHLYPTTTLPEIAKILEHSDASLLFVQGLKYKQHVQKGLKALRTTRLKNVVFIPSHPQSRYEKDKGSESGSQLYRQSGSVIELQQKLVMSWDEFLDRAQQVGDEDVAERTSALKMEDLAVIIYSPSTSKLVPRDKEERKEKEKETAEIQWKGKGVMLSHRNLSFTTQMLSRAYNTSEKDVLVSFLPLAHIFQQLWTIYVPIYSGCKVYFSQNVKLKLIKKERRRTVNALGAVCSPPVAREGPEKEKEKTNNKASSKQITIETEEEKDENEMVHARDKTVEEESELYISEDNVLLTDLTDVQPTLIAAPPLFWKRVHCALRAKFIRIKERMEEEQNEQRVKIISTKHKLNKLKKKMKKSPGKAKMKKLRKQKRQLKEQKAAAKASMAEIQEKHLGEAQVLVEQFKLSVGMLRLRLGLTGLSHISIDLIDFFQEYGHVPIHAIYVVPECSGVVCLNTPEYDKPGTVGLPLPHTEVKLVDNDEPHALTSSKEEKKNAADKEKNEDSSDDEDDEEDTPIERAILIKGDNVFMGYWKDPSTTEERLKDGWFHTGDLGYILPHKGSGYLVVSRKKGRYFSDNQGRLVLPERIEKLLEECPLVETTMVVGENRPYPVALVVAKDPSHTRTLKELYDGTIRSFTLSLFCHIPLLLPSSVPSSRLSL
ncbi:8-demethylnovobiocic acid synthase [Balamuthia mandrillaris]